MVMVTGGNMAAAAAAAAAADCWEGLGKKWKNFEPWLNALSSTLILTDLNLTNIMATAEACPLTNYFLSLLNEELAIVKLVK